MPGPHEERVTRGAQLLGFRKRAIVSAGLESETWEARGEHVGWADDEYLYLNPPVAYAAVSRLLAEQGIELPKKPATLWGELYAAGWIALTDPGRPGRSAISPVRASSG